VRRPRALLATLEVSDRTVSGTVRMTGGAGAQSRLQELARGPVQLRFRAAGASAATVMAELEPGPDSTLAFAAELPDPGGPAWGDVPRERRLWTVDLVQGRRSERLAWPADGPREWWPVAADAALTAQRTERGNVQLRETTHFAVVEDVVLDDDVIVVEGRWLRPVGPGTWQPRLVREGPGEATLWPAGGLQPDGTRFRCDIPLLVAPWGRGLRPPPTGSWLLELVADDGSVVRPRLTADLVARTVLRHRGPRCEVQLRRGNAHQPMLHIAPPLPAAHVSPHGQRILRERYLAAAAGPVGSSVVFQVGDGEHAGDSPLALLQELRRRGDRRRVVWAVSDLSHEVPEDAVPVLVGSPDWYDELAVAGRIVLAGDGVPFLRPRPGQVVLQTFLGYPADPTTGPWFEDPTPGSVEQRLDEARRRWSVVVGAAADHPEDPASRVYGWTGPRIDVGWPRRDLFTGEDAGARRRATRHALGLGGEDVAVLWAPAWRPNASDGRWQPFPSPVALADVAVDLPPDVVILLCGGTDASAPAGLRSVDVRWHPRFDELVVASDAAAVGTPSLAADHRTTGRPQLWLDGSVKAGDLRDLVERARADGTAAPVVPPARGAAAAVVDTVWPETT